MRQVYAYDYDGAIPQREIVFLENYEDLEDIPQTAVVISKEAVDLISITKTICAIEDFWSTDFRIVDAYCVVIGGVVQFEYEGHEYYSNSREYNAILDKVFDNDKDAYETVGMVLDLLGEIND